METTTGLRYVGEWRMLSRLAKLASFLISLGRITLNIQVHAHPDAGQKTCIIKTTWPDVTTLATLETACFPCVAGTAYAEAAYAPFQCLLTFNSLGHNYDLLRPSQDLSTSKPV